MPKLPHADHKSQHFPEVLLTPGRLDVARFRPVDMLYNIGRGGDGQVRGYDVIDREDKQRYYVVQGSDFSAEERIIEALGDKAVLPRLGADERYSVYTVPEGARLLSRTLEAAPYEEAYMKRLADSGAKLLDALRSLDAQSFGINLGHIAIAHNGRQGEIDDSYLTIVPPVGQR